MYAHLCAQMYPLALGEMLEQHPWGFSTTTQELAPLATRPAGVHQRLPAAFGLRAGVAGAVARVRPADPLRDACR